MVTRERFFIKTGLWPVMSLGAFLFMVIACSGPATMSDDAAPLPVQRDVPWIYGQVDIEGKVCSVGFRGATFYPADARQGAADHCRAELAKNVESHIVTMEIDWARDGLYQYLGDSFVEATVAATNTVLGSIEMVDYYYDRAGYYSADGATMTYVLCCVPESVINGLRK